MPDLTTKDALLERIVTAVGAVADKFSEYLPLTGGTIDGDLTVTGTVNGTASAAKKNTQTVIPANADLNNYKTVGDYYCGSDADAATLSNCPTANSFSMTVKQAGAGYMQVLYVGTVIFTRKRTSSTWHSWYKYEGTVVSLS